MADRAPANPRPSASEMEFASRLSSKRPVNEKQHRPATIGEAMARAGLISTVAAGNVEQATPEDQRQPRLVAGATCLIVAFETWCVLSALIFLWER